MFFGAQTVQEIYRKKRKVEKQGVCVFLLFPVYRQEAKFFNSTYNNAKLWTLQTTTQNFGLYRQQHKVWDFIDIK